MAGLQRICKAYGSMTIQGKKWVWDYATDEAVREADMPKGSERWKASEKAQALLRAEIAHEKRT